MSDTLEKSADRLIELANRQAARIEALKVALRRIRSLEEKNVAKYAQEIAIAALDKDAGS